MQITYSIKEAQTRLPELVRRVERGGMATITRHERTVAYLMGAEQLASLIETMEILSNPEAMAAIAEAEAGKGKVYSLDELGD